MSKDNRRGTPDVQTQFLHAIPSLVDKCIGTDSKTRRARNELISGLIAQPFYDPTLLAFEHAQTLLVREQNPRAVRNIVEFLGELTLKTGNAILETGQPRQLNINSQTTAASNRIIENDGKIQKSKHVQTLLDVFLPKGYASALKIAHFALEGKQKGITTVELHQTSPGQSPEEKSKMEEELKLFNDWLIAIQGIYTKGKVEIAFDPTLKDRFVDLLRLEPRMTTYSKERIITRKAAGMSIDDIEALPYPLSDEDDDKVTMYLSDILSSRSSHLADLDLVSDLFFNPTPFSYDSKPVPYKNLKLFTNINAWQERFIYQLAYEQDQAKVDQLKTILSNAPESKTALIMLCAQQYTIYPYEYDPLFDGVMSLKRAASHPLLYPAICQYQEEHPEVSVIYMFADEIGKSYFESTVLPQLERRLKEFGVGKKFEKVIAITKEGLAKHPFSEIHMDTIKEIFFKNCGEEFLFKLNSRAAEIEEITLSVWQSIFEEGMHYLPMQQGLNTVDFSEGSVADILGLALLTFNTSGSPQDWEINVSFKLQGTHIGIIGVLDQEGNLKLKAPIEKDIPGLYTMLNHIAVLAFHDLVVQAKKEEQERNGIKPIAEAGKKKKHRLESQTSKAHPAALPRRQTDTALISDVYKKTGYTPRRVELHPATLRGAKDYADKVRSYQEALAKNVSREELSRLQLELEGVRRNAYKISTAKKKSIPARFELQSVIDPATGENRYLETWVVEHTSPRPTDEELQSPIILFERYYKHSSALASLDQLKPWFIGK
ncbi:MAG: hypothetical protein Q7K55_07655 [Candidatus Levybacteria bacterium]|nr:hypothetical protein [Candidatus Levybacteria bacterium]